MIKRVIAAIITCCMILSCVACEPENQITYTNASIPIETPIDLDIIATQFSSILFQTDSKVYYQNIEDKTLSIFVYNIATETTDKVGDIKNFLMSNTSVAELDGKIYFFVTTSTLFGKTNNFYSVDTHTDKLKKIYDENLYQSFNYLISFEGTIYSLKGDKKGDNAITFIESYNVSSNKRETVKKHIANHNEKTGELLLNMTCDNDKIYIYSQKYSEGEIRFFLDTYDKEFNLLEAKEFKNKEYLNVFSSAIPRLSVKNNNLYVQNFSNASILEVVNENVKPIITDFEKPLWLSYRFSNESPWILYYRGEPYVYKLNENGELQKSNKLSVENGYAINMVTQNKDSVLIHLKSIDDSTKKKLILYSFTDLF